MTIASHMNGIGAITMEPLYILKLLLLTWITTMMLFSNVGSTTSGYREECHVMQNISNIVDQQRRVSMMCSPNAQCTGYHCAGNYTYSGIYSGMSDVTVDFCFGMALHPCHPDNDAHFYVQIPEKGTDFDTNVNHTMQVQLHDVHYFVSKSPSYTLDGFVEISKYSSGRENAYGGRKYINMEMIFKMRISIGLGFLQHQTWPDDFEFVMVPDSKLYLPICDSTVVTPTGPPQTCNPYAGPLPPSPPPTPAAPLYPAQGNNPKSCLSNSVKQSGGCGEGEMCEYNRCVCKLNYIRQQWSQECVPSTGTTPDVYFPDVEEVTKKSSNTVVIAVSVGVCVLVVMVIAGIILYKYRQHRLRYAQHDVLMNNDDDNDYDTDPIDIST